jgi:hypothetical protein
MPARMVVESFMLGMNCFVVGVLLFELIWDNRMEVNAS